MSDRNEVQDSVVGILRALMVCGDPRSTTYDYDRGWSDALLEAEKHVRALFQVESVRVDEAVSINSLRIEVGEWKLLTESAEVKLDKSRTEVARLKEELDRLKAIHRSIHTGGWRQALEREQRVVDLATGVREAVAFCDYEVREWLPNEHPSCDSSCAHGAYERKMFDRLDRFVTRLRALAGSDV